MHCSVQEKNVTFINRGNLSLIVD